jgi:hypothetical protein
MNRLKLISIFCVLVLVGIIANSSQQFLSAAKDDEILIEIVNYKNWQSVSKTDEKMADGTYKIFNSSVSG